MSAPKFTPGPWVIYPGTDGTEICAVDRTPGLPIREIITRPVRCKDWIANATLIAAAPRMHSALAAIAALPGERLDEAKEIAVAAMKEAEGNA